jgi:hypothetical protein
MSDAVARAAVHAEVGNAARIGGALGIRSPSVEATGTTTEKVGMRKQVGGDSAPNLKSVVVQVVGGVSVDAGHQ